MAIGTRGQYGSSATVTNRLRRDPEGREAFYRGRNAWLRQAGQITEQKRQFDVNIELRREQNRLSARQFLAQGRYGEGRRFTDDPTLATGGGWGPGAAATRKRIDRVEHDPTQYALLGDLYKAAGVEMEEGAILRGGVPAGRPTQTKTMIGRRAPVRGASPSWAERWQTERDWEKRLKLVASAQKGMAGSEGSRSRVPWGSWAGKKGYGQESGGRLTPQLAEELKRIEEMVRSRDTA